MKRNYEEDLKSSTNAKPSLLWIQEPWRSSIANTVAVIVNFNIGIESYKKNSEVIILVKPLLSLTSCYLRIFCQGFLIFLIHFLSIFSSHKTVYSVYFYSITLWVQSMFESLSIEMKFSPWLITVVVSSMSTYLISATIHKNIGLILKFSSKFRVLNNYFVYLIH